MTDQSKYKHIKRSTVLISLALGSVFTLPSFAESNTDVMNTSGVVTRVVRSNDWQAWDNRLPSGQISHINNRQDNISHSFFDDMQFVTAAKDVLNTNLIRPRKRLRKIRFKKKIRSSQSKTVSALIDKPKKIEEGKIVIASSISAVVTNSAETRGAENVAKKENARLKIKPIISRVTSATTWQTVNESLPKLMKELSP